MNLNTLTKTLLLSTLVLGSSSFQEQSHAGFVRIINTAESNVRAEVIPEPASCSPPYCWKCVGGICEANAGQCKEIIIPPEAFCSQQNYSIEGTIGGILFNGRCKNLSTVKDYEVSFYDTTFGIGCKCREI